ncbi:MAG: glycosyltransferase [Lentisphaerae bacterium]|nr:glycosyltransferase [Lentisphaerota bacterium]
MRPLTIALVDGFDDGHHLTLLRHYARALLGMGHRVVELLPNPARTEAWFAEHCAGQRDRLHLHAFRHWQEPSPFWRLRHLWPPLASWAHAGRAVAEAERASGWQVDLVFFCWLDHYILGVSPLCRFALPWLLPRPWSGLFFHPWHLRAPGGDPDHHYAVTTGQLRTRHCRGVAVLDEGIADRLQALLQRPVIRFPDQTEEALPAVEPALVQRLRGAIRGRKVIGLIGDLWRRKGVLAFLRAVARAQDRDWVFLLAGALGDTQQRTFFPDEWPGVDAVLRRPPPNLLVHLQRIEDDRDFNAVINLCDVLFAAYDSFGHSSGIVTKAAVFRKPILVSPGFCMAERVARYRTGLALDPADPTAVVDALACLLDPAALARRIGTPDFAGCHRAHSQMALQAALEQLVALA